MSGEQNKDFDAATFHFDPKAADEVLANAERKAAEFRAAGDNTAADKALRPTTVEGVLEEIRDADGTDGDAFAGVYVTVLAPSLRLRLGTDSWPEHYRAYLARKTYEALQKRKTDLTAEGKGEFTLDERENLALSNIRDNSYLPSRKAVMRAFGFSDPMAPSKESESASQTKTEEEEEKEKEKEKEEEEEEEIKKKSSKKVAVTDLIHELLPTRPTKRTVGDPQAAKKALQELEAAHDIKTLLHEPEGGSEGVPGDWVRKEVVASTDRKDIFWRFCADRRAPQFEVLTAEYVAAFAAYIARRITELALRCPQYIAARSEPITVNAKGKKTQKLFEFCVMDAGGGSGRFGHFLQQYLDNPALSLAKNHIKVHVVSCDNFADRIYTKFPTEMMDVSEAIPQFLPTIVVCVWMPLGIDWTSIFRSTRSVQEYILIGPPETTGHVIDTWKCAENDWEITELRGLSKLQICRCDGHNDIGHSVTTSFRRPESNEHSNAIAVIVDDVEVEDGQHHTSEFTAITSASNTTPATNTSSSSSSTSSSSSSKSNDSSVFVTKSSSSSGTIDHTIVKPDLSVEAVALEQAMKEKTVGGKLFRVQSYAKALEHYETAEEIIRKFYKMPDVQKKYKEILVQLLTNSTLCCLRMNDYDTAKTKAEAAIKEDSLNAKAHYLLGKSLLGLICPEEEKEKEKDCCDNGLDDEERKKIETACLSAFARAKELSPNSIDIAKAEDHAKELLSKCKKQEKQEKQEEKEEEKQEKEEKEEEKEDKQQDD